MKRGLVLAGGGVAGVAWELGILRGIHDIDPALEESITASDVVVGTSAGSVVAAQITSGVPVEDLYAAQLRETSSEIDVDLDFEELMTRFAEASAGAATPEDLRRQIGVLALSTATVGEAERRAVIAARLPTHTWPDHVVLVTAIDAESGEFRILTRESGVPLVDAVAASCAVPGVWPPVSIDGHRYIDGGVRSATNADLAAGCERVLVITPTSADTPTPWDSLNDEIEVLKPAAVMAVHADEASAAAFGTNPLSPATRGPSARAGREIGRTQAAAIAAFWSQRS
ncbi:MAG TPA: patatin-like phospholipase family protein [Streptosporangiaceae bacterium]|nr:patatin-like phospholipase family protein [Streptosporangiaceae bacterium]